MRKILLLLIAVLVVGGAAAVLRMRADPFALFILYPFVLGGVCLLIAWLTVLYLSLRPPDE
jgi:hypothetical protein